MKCSKCKKNTQVLIVGANYFNEDSGEVDDEDLIDKDKPICERCYGDFLRTKEKDKKPGKWAVYARKLQQLSMFDQI